MWVARGGGHGSLKVPDATKHAKAQDGEAELVERVRSDLGRGPAGPTSG